MTTEPFAGPLVPGQPQGKKSRTDRGRRKLDSPGTKPPLTGSCETGLYPQVTVNAPTTGGQPVWPSRMNPRASAGIGLLLGASFTTAVILAAQANNIHFASLVGGIGCFIAGLILIYGGRTP